jgi:dipeptidyl aminopeptidase/acylaminoacyl peptidase
MLSNDDAALLREWSPLYQADAIITPLFVYQGENDSRVPRAQADAIVQALSARGVPVEYLVAAGEGHTVDRHETQAESLDKGASLCSGCHENKNSAGVTINATPAAALRNCVWR